MGGTTRSGKSTWCFLILPLWAMAHQHRKFIAAFADSATQAQQHLTSLKRELDTNADLRAHYPQLCNPAMRPTGHSVADSQGLYIAHSGAAFQARGIDASTLGTKVGNRRPDLLLFDDIEPDASNYSDYQKEKRLATVTNAVFPMNNSAVVCMVGTATMSGSIIHDLVRQVTDAADSDLERWPKDEDIRTRYYPALDTDDRGEPVSLWPARWSTEYLESIRHTNSFALNYQNQPAHRDGDYWSPDDFQYATLGTAATRWLLSADPAVTTKGTSDWTGLAVVAYAPGRTGAPQTGAQEPTGLEAEAIRRGRCEVVYAGQVKLTGEPFRAEVLKLLGRYPRIKGVLIEVNQAGELWHTILHHLPAGVKLMTHTVSESKEVRFAEALEHYQLRRVLHTTPHRALEAQMTGFPKMAHDDIADAVCSGVLRFLSPPPKVVASQKAESYV